MSINQKYTYLSLVADCFKTFKPIKNKIIKYFKIRKINQQKTEQKKVMKKQSNIKNSEKLKIAKLQKWGHKTKTQENKNINEKEQYIKIS